MVATDEEEGQSKLIVRGDKQSGYHMDIYEKTVRELPGLHVSPAHKYAIPRTQTAKCQDVQV